MSRRSARILARLRNNANVPVEQTDITFNQLSQMASEGGEGIVLLGCGGDINEWYNGVMGLLEENGLASKRNFSTPFILTTTGGRIDVALFFVDESGLDIGRLAMWRLRFGDCSWISDYVVNYRNQH